MQINIFRKEYIVLDCILSIIFNKEKDTVFIKDSIEHFATREIYGIKTSSVENLKEEILPYMDVIIEYYKEKCSS